MTSKSRSIDEDWRVLTRETALARIFELHDEIERLRHCADTCGGPDNDGRCPMKHLLRGASETGAKFANVSCSQCGRDFGPGEHGFSHCKDHP